MKGSLTTTVEVTLELEIEYEVDPTDASVGDIDPVIRDASIRSWRQPNQQWRSAFLGQEVLWADPIMSILDEAILDHYNEGEE